MSSAEYLTGIRMVAKWIQRALARIAVDYTLIGRPTAERADSASHLAGREAGERQAFLSFPCATQATAATAPNGYSRVYGQIYARKHNATTARRLDIAEWYATECAAVFGDVMRRSHTTAAHA